MNARTLLYGKAQAECLRIQETKRDDDRKYGLLLEHIGACRRLVDIGAGWGQFLALVQDRVDELWAVDESPDRVADLRQKCPKARVVMSRADQMDLPSDYFDVVVTSQMLHEAKLFGEPGEMRRVLGEIARMLRPGGRYLLLDHQDAGEGEVVVELPADQQVKLDEFERKYRFYTAEHEQIDDRTLRMTRRCLQDYLTKDWSLDSSMESIEMNETHNVFEQRSTEALVTEAGLQAHEWIGFCDITVDLDRHGGKMIEGEPWMRKFLLVATKRGAG